MMPQNGIEVGAPFSLHPSDICRSALQLETLLVKQPGLLAARSFGGLVLVIHAYCVARFSARMRLRCTYSLENTRDLYFNRG